MARLFSFLASRDARTAALALAALTLGLAACNRDTTCTTEVTQGSGTFRGTAKGSRAEADLRRESMRIACGQLCGASGGKEGCVGRCAVDAEAGKVGARVVCAKEGSSR